MADDKKNERKMPAKNKLPYVDNYPPLRDWLRSIDARCNWQLDLGSPLRAYVESWTSASGGEFIIVVQSNQHGWNVYTAFPSGDIDDTLTDASARIGAKRT